MFRKIKCRKLFPCMPLFFVLNLNRYKFILEQEWDNYLGTIFFLQIWQLKKDGGSIVFDSPWQLAPTVLPTLFVLAIEMILSKFFIRFLVRYHVYIKLKVQIQSNLVYKPVIFITENDYTIFFCSGFIFIWLSEPEPVCFTTTMDNFVCTYVVSVLCGVTYLII